MVKLGRILKPEYRDDVASKRSWKASMKTKSVSDLSVPEDASQATGRGAVSLPPKLQKIIETQLSGQTAPEERDEVETPDINRTPGANPHHFALTRAAQMALRSMPMPADFSDDRSESSTIALIDSIVKTSDDPALIDALQAMVTEVSGQSLQQRETLALVADSIMEKKAAKEALQRAVLAESRLNESLKKCGPELAGDAAALVAAASETDAATAPVSSGNSTGFFNRINRSLTATSQNGHRRIPFGRPKSRGRKSKSKPKNEKMEDERTAILEEDPVLFERDAASAEMEEAFQESLSVADPSISGIQIPTRDEDEVEEMEGRDDVEQEPEERETIFSKESSGAPMASKRRNKYKHIASLGPETFIQFDRTSSRGSQTYDAGDQSTYATGFSSKYTGTFAGEATDNAVEVGTSAEEAEEGTLLEMDKDSGSESESDDSESESEEEEDDPDGNDLTDGEPDDPTAMSGFFDDDEEKIEYTIFELESKLSRSTNASSNASLSSTGLSSIGSTDSEDGAEHTDNDTLGNCTDNDETCDEASGDEATCEGTTGDEATLNEGEETGVSAGESGSDGESADESSDDEDGDGLLFSSFCQRPDSSYEDDGNDYDKKHRSHYKSRRKSRRATEDVPSILTYVTGYFDCDEGVDEKRKERRRRRKRRS